MNPAGTTKRNLRPGRRLKRAGTWLLVLLGVTVAFFWAMRAGLLWEPQIRAYERADRACPPRPGVIVFTGSSSIRLWQGLAQDMSPLDVINRGFGGAAIAQVDDYADRIIMPHRPRAVVLYAGDNDLGFPFFKSPDVVVRDFQQLARRIHAQLPDTWIYYISMKPAPAGDWSAFHRTNGMIEAFIRTQDHAQFIDVSASMLDAQGRSRRDLYGADPMHMDAKGYAVWTSIIRPVLLSRIGAGPGETSVGCAASVPGAARPRAAT